MLYTETLYKLSKDELTFLVKELILNCDTKAAIDYIKNEALNGDDDYFELLNTLEDYEVLKREENNMDPCDEDLKNATLFY